MKSAHLVALTLLLVSVERAASASPAVAKPFGIEIGKTTCREAISLIHGAAPEKVDDKGSILISMQEPGRFYEFTSKGDEFMSIKYKALDLKPSDRVGTSSGARAASRNVKSPL